MLSFIIALVPLLAPKTLKILTLLLPGARTLDLISDTCGTVHLHWLKHGEHMANT